mgnify:FL=1
MTNHRWYPRPVFFVHDLSRALQFYVNGLGFVKKWRVAAVLLAGLASPAAAQSDPTVWRVREVVLDDLRSRPGFNVHTRFVSDSADLARYVACRGTGAQRRCTLKDTVPVVRLVVTLLAPDSARVQVGRYRMFTERCPSRTPIDPPLLGVDANETRTLVFRSGRWAETGSRVYIAC